MKGSATQITGARLFQSASGTFEKLTPPWRPRRHLLRKIVGVARACGSAIRERVLAPVIQRKMTKKAPGGGKLHADLRVLVIFKMQGHFEKLTPPWRPRRHLRRKTVGVAPFQVRGRT